MSKLSDVFKYISQFRHAGHQVGRKVGDMLELLTYSAMCGSKDLNARIQVEPKLFGFSGAGHKVEFAIKNTPSFKPSGDPLIINGGEITDPREIIGFIECKKVGVEQTVNSTFKNNTGDHRGPGRKIQYEQTLTVSFNPRNINVSYKYAIKIDRSCILTVTSENDGATILKTKIANDYRIIFTLSEDGKSEVLDNHQSLRDVPYSLQSCRILDIFRIEEDCILGIINDCLTGPQTPEKAKQASFVALDVRKERFNSFDKRDAESECISVLVLTEFSHWEKKSQNMIRSSIDYNLVVPDSLIVLAFQEFEKEFGPVFYDNISKENYDRNPIVTTLCDQITRALNYRIFEDIEDKKMKTISVKNGKLLIE